MAVNNKSLGKKISTTRTKTVIVKKPGSNEYLYQKFGPKALALINKYNLQIDDSYKKLISSYERINSLPKDDPRKPNLIDLWEGEFNRIFKHFWENFANGQFSNERTISGWKDRLDVKPVSVLPDEKRRDLISRLSPTAADFKGNKTTKEEILFRAGYQNQVKTEKINFTATAKTGQNLFEIENLLSAAEEKGVGEPESILKNSFAALQSSENEVDSTKSFIRIDEETELMTSTAIPDPNLLDFINEGTVATSLEENQKSDEVVNKEINKETKNKELKEVKETEEKKTENIGYIAKENMSREEFNRTNNIELTENSFVQEDQSLAALELGTEFFQKHLTEEFDIKTNVYVTEKMGKIEYSSKDELILPEKRNILSKEGFEINLNPEKTSLLVTNPTKIDKSDEVRPYHEERPVGHYPINYDASKRPMIHDLIAANERESLALDEMTHKVEYLRQLRNDRRHRVNMMKIERANSYIITRARRLAESRELKRLKRREDVNVKAIEKAERLRRLHERQKLIELMKERQLKRTEEKRVASVLRLERERRYERDAKYRAEIATIDAQIRQEQELIKGTELKMKAYFTKINDNEMFDESLKVAKEIVPSYKAIQEKAATIQQLEEKKRKDRVEKISRKFIKNIK
ncbi:hypothetical protein SCANT_v1c03220 [Spiroplasma cantharicola]|uniref:Uncharacterized protein n=2 Tax=Spiroplasma cantharicola TaxID=362837 RepID=A0A0M4KE80_9MOLU|nr:hypothetical protein SCANT_v1c03220 [Spiroplasma cantharicola]